MKKMFSVMLIVAILTMAMFCAGALASDAAGPAPYSGDGIPSGNQFIQPDTPDSPGPAPNAGDGIPDGSGF